MRVVVFSFHDFEKNHLIRQNTGKHELIFCPEKLGLETVSIASGAQAVAIFTSDDCSAAVLEKLNNLGVKYIALRSAGHDHVDLHKANSLGMRAANVPAYSPYAIAEHAVALLMALNRKIVMGQKLMDLNDYRLDPLIGFDVHGKTVGVIGTGKIGAAFASIMHGFGCHLLGFDPIPDEDLACSTALEYVSLDKLYQLSDIISLHCPLNSSSYHLLSTEAFSKMKQGVVILNTSRGKTIDTQALIKSIDEGKVSSAGLDVYEHEKGLFFENFAGQKIKDDLLLKLRSYPNVLITGHQGFLTREALDGIASTTISNLDSWQATGESPNDL